MLSVGRQGRHLVVVPVGHIVSRRRYGATVSVGTHSPHCTFDNFDTFTWTLALVLWLV